MLRDAVEAGHLDLDRYLQYRMYQMQRQQNAALVSRQSSGGYTSSDLPGIRYSGGTAVSRGVEGFNSYRRSIIDDPVGYLEGFDFSMAEMSLDWKSTTHFS